MNPFKLSYTLFALVFFLLSSCVTESNESAKPITADQLTGKWDLVKANRNGKETLSLEGTIIQIEGGKMTCNFTGEAVETPLNFNNNQLVQKDQTYKIARFAGDSLFINTKLMSFEFEMIFIKTN